MSPALEAAILVCSVTALIAVLGFVFYQVYSLGWSARDGKAIGEVMVLERQLAEVTARNKVLEREADSVANAGQGVVDRAVVGRDAPDGPDGDGVLLGRPDDPTVAAGGGAPAAPGAPA